MIALTPTDRKRLAAAVGLHEQYLYQCLTDRRETPVEHCAPLEAHAAKLGIAGVTRQALRPDDWWVHWPELVTPDQPAPPAAAADATPGTVPPAEPAMWPLATDRRLVDRNQAKAA